MNVHALLSAALVGTAGVASADPATHFNQRCAACHDQPADAKTPDSLAIRRMNNLRVRHAVLRGPMRQYTEGLSRDDVVALAQHLSGDQENLIPERAFCAGEPALDASVSRWGYDAANTRWQRNTTVNAANVANLSLKWAFGVPNVSEMRSQPVVTSDTIFLSTVAGRLYALDRQTGCIKWTYSTERPLRTSLTLGRAGAKAALFVGDQGATVHAIDAATGKLIWQQRVGLFVASVVTGAPVNMANDCSCRSRRLALRSPCSPTSNAASPTAACGHWTRLPARFCGPRT